MSKPQNVIKKLNGYEIIPEKIQKGNYVAELPTLTSDETLVVGTQLNAKQDTLTAGTGITITNNVISATNVIVNGVYYEEEFTELCFTANTAGSTVELCRYGSPGISGTAYSTDGSTWTTFTPSTTSGTNTITLTNVGDKVYFRNNITRDFSIYVYLYFVMTGSIAASGSVNSMYSATNFNSVATLSYDYCYCWLFNGCTSLTTPPALPATSLSSYCYSSMFSDCRNLTTAPELPATSLKQGCYSGLFYRCTSLATVPTLPATSLTSSCYSNMFSGCTSLTTAPSLPATSLTSSCYFNMFSGCTSLITPPTLYATTLAEQCYYNMFSGCTSLTTAPSLPATSLADSCYYYMFSGCTSLTTVPNLPATTLAEECYYGMFDGCTNITTAPALPVTTLVSGCYSNMFRGCSSLTAVPTLPATTLVENCYYRMFYQCTSLYVSDSAISGTAEQVWTIPKTGTFTNTTAYDQAMFFDCLGTRSSNTMSGATGESHTYYTQNTPIE